MKPEGDGEEAKGENAHFTILPLNLTPPPHTQSHISHFFYLLNLEESAFMKETNRFIIVLNFGP